MSCKGRWLLLLMMLVNVHWRHRLPVGTLLLLRRIGVGNVVKLRIIICRALVGITCGIRHASSTSNASASNGCIGMA